MGDNRMNKIDARSKSVRELLDGVKYGIDYYQREYKWTTKQITELLEDLEAKFFDSYKEEHSRSRVEGYTHYFLGSLVISSRNGQKFIIDGQQRRLRHHPVLCVKRGNQEPSKGRRMAHLLKRI
jgi:uncharacterized protein with ParB-like and HNH nuclease domain